MASNRGVVYLGPGRVEVQSIDFPVLALGTRKCNHGVILKVISIFVPLRMDEATLLVGDDAVHGETAYAITVDGGE